MYMYVVHAVPGGEGGGYGSLGRESSLVGALESM